MRDAQARRDGDRLILETSRLRREFAFNGGSLISRSLEDRATGRRIVVCGDEPDCILPGEDAAPEELAFEVCDCPATNRTPEHVRVIVESRIGRLDVRRTFRLYPECPAITCEYAFRGVPAGVWRRKEMPPDGTPTRADVLASVRRRDCPAPRMEHLVWSRMHYRVTCFEYFDITDERNTLVRRKEALAYTRPDGFDGNLALVRPTLEDWGLFLLKEAPCSDVQLAPPGCDFVFNTDGISLFGAGVDPADVREEEWTRGYGFVTGIAVNDEAALLDALRDYQSRARVAKPRRDHMIMVNTWGDRSQEKKLGEAFALREIEAARRLGATHFQLDDGWQQGASPNWATPGGTFESYYDAPGYWEVHPVRFPNGLGPIARRARDLGIELCLWFSPCRKDHYAHWRDDAETLIGFYRRDGIRTFKIDSVTVTAREGERNFRSFLERVMEATDDEAVFNLDVTAGRRFGYHFFAEYGNLFLENRYTDWGNYYPHWTLRNLWQLAHTLPAQRFQIEFLNRWRNAAKYPKDDPLAPSRVPFDYCFAVTLPAQPLAWFEASELPEEAFGIAPMVRTYLQHQERLHAGRIRPIGQEPSGVAWTGFQSVRTDGGYVLVFREKNDRTSHRMRLEVPAGAPVRFRHVLGHGRDFTGRVGKDGAVAFKLARPFTFALYAYDAPNPALKHLGKGRNQ